MRLIRRLGLYLGGGIALVGFAVATAFIGGRKGSDAVAGLLFQSLSLENRLIGIGTGLLILVLGLVIIKVSGELTENTDH